eukprot:COSAG03_NODE_1187_length_4618_cov_6.759239_1_plen_166_part_00
MRVTYNFYIQSCKCTLTQAPICTHLYIAAASFNYKIPRSCQIMTAWRNNLVTTATADLRRTQCAEAAAARLKHPQVNLLGLGESGEATRRAKCLEAAMMRFVLGNEPSQSQPRGRGTKRKAHTALLRELATEWGGTAAFNPLLCGRGCSLKQCAREPWGTNNAWL